jgi:hypothetical protein
MPLVDGAWRSTFFGVFRFCAFEITRSFAQIGAYFCEQEAASAQGKAAISLRGKGGQGSA